MVLLQARLLGQSSLPGLLNSNRSGLAGLPSRGAHTQRHSSRRRRLLCPPRAQAAPLPSPPPPPPPPGARPWRQHGTQQQPEQQQQGSWFYREVARLLAAAAVLACTLVGALWAWRPAIASAPPCAPSPAPAAAAAVGKSAAAAVGSGPATLWPAAAGDAQQAGSKSGDRGSSRGAIASVSIGGTSPVFKTERPFDIAGFKLAGLLQQVLGAPVPVKIVALILAGAPIIYALGCLHSAITGVPLPRSVFKVYTVTLRAPGARVTEETSWPAALLINSAFLLGVFTFAVIIAFVSEDLKSNLREVRHGNIPLAMADHTLVLNWNRQAPLLLRQMATNGHGDSRTLGRNIVVLADRDKNDLEADVSRSMHGSSLRWITRRGAPHSAKDLENVAAAHAKTVIVLHPDKDEVAEVHKTATMLALQSCRSHPSTTLRRQRVVLQNPEIPQASTSAQLASRNIASVVQRSLPSSANMRLVEVNGHRNMARLIAQSAVQPWVSTILGQIAQSAPGAPDFHVVDLPGWHILEGSSGGSSGSSSNGDGAGGAAKATDTITYRAARRKLDNAVVCGYISHASHRTHLNPPDSAVLSRADRLIVLSHKDKPELAPGGSTAAGLDVAQLRQRLEAAQPPAPTPKSIVVVGWSGPLSDLITGLCDFAAPGSQITVVSSQRPPDFPGEGTICEVEGRTLLFLEGSVLDREAYEKAGVATAHAVILGSLQTEGDFKDADARLLSSLLMVQDIANAVKPSKPPHIVACIHYPETVQTAHHILTELAKTQLSAELLQPGELVAGMLLQVAHEPALAPALSELIDSCKGNELYLRRAPRYGLDGGTHSFAEVCELARLRGETAIGLISGEGKMHLVPDSQFHSHFSRDARIVVLSEY